MTEGIIGKEIHEIKAVRQQIVFAVGAQQVSVTANVPDGYNFLCWVNSASNGWVGWTYIENSLLRSTSVWTSTQQTVRATEVTFLCYK